MAPTREISTERPFPNQVKPSLQVRTKKATASSLPGATSNLSESRYWSEKYGLGPRTTKTSTFAHPRKAKLDASSSAVVHALVFGPPAFSQVSPLAVASGPRVRLYGTSAQSPLHRTLRDHTLKGKEQTDIDADRQVQTGGSLALDAAYRNDGRLLAVATDNGQVRVADATSRATLCTFQSPTNLPVRSVSWFRDGQHVLAGGDDGVVRVWSLSGGGGDDEGQTLSSGTPKLELTGHGDAIRCAALWQASIKSQKKWTYSALACTGSYDNKVRIWRVDFLDTAKDEIRDRCLSVLEHKSPVEALLLMPSSNPDVPVWLLSASGTTIKVFNPMTGNCVCDLHSKHRKTITSLVAVPRTNDELESVHMRIMSGGLDSLLRIHSWNSTSGTLDHLHGVTLPVPVTALAFGETQNRVAIGTVDGKVLIRQRGPSVVPKKREGEPRAGTFAHSVRGKNARPAPGDFVLKSNTKRKRRKLQDYDLALKQFRLGEALDLAIKSKNPVITTAVIEELGKRRALSIAISNRDEFTVGPLLDFAVRYIANPKYTNILLDFSNRLIDIYADFAERSNRVRDTFKKLRKHVFEEARTQRNLIVLGGQLDALITNIAMTKDEEDNSK